MKKISLVLSEALLKVYSGEFSLSRGGEKKWKKQHTVRILTLEKD